MWIKVFVTCFSPDGGEGDPRWISFLASAIGATLATIIWLLVHYGV